MSMINPEATDKVVRISRKPQEYHIQGQTSKIWIIILGEDEDLRKEYMKFLLEYEVSYVILDGVVLIDNHDHSLIDDINGWNIN